MRVGFVTTYFDSYYRGPIWHQLNRLREHSDVTTFASNRASYQYFSGKGAALQPHEKLAEHWDIMRFRIAWKVKGFVWPSGLKELLKVSKPDIIHSNEYYQPISWQSFKAAKDMNVPFLFTQRTPCYPNPGRKVAFKLLFNRLGSKVVHGSAHIISLTTFGKELLVNDFGISPDKVTVIPNSLDLSNYRNADGISFRKTYGIPEDAFVIGHIGRVFAMKRIDLLVRVFSELRKVVPNSRLLVVGPHDPAEKSGVDAVIRELDVRNVIFTGPIPNEKVKHAAAASDVITLTSQKEPFGYSLLEGMALGKPAIAFAIGGIPDIIKDGQNGCLVKWCDIGEYSEKLHLLAEDHSLRKKLGAAAKNDVEKKFNLDVTTPALLKIYESLR